MVPDREFECGIQALLDGQPLPAAVDDSSASPGAPLQIIDAIARAHRTAIFGKEFTPDRAESRWGHLEMRGELGRGASGTVYRAWDTRLAREVALKVFAADVGSADAALEEGRLLARLDHSHIVRVFGSDTHDGIPGMWMELLEGQTLDEVLARDGVFGAEEALLIGMDLARALAAVHDAGLLHRDIKARNVVRERGGRIVLMDLGAGRTTEVTVSHSDATGTPMYMAPEVLAGGPATVRSDLYCLGVLLFRLLTGTFPVTATDLAGLRAAHVARTRQPLAGLRPDLDSSVVAVIERGCDPDPDARYHNAVEFETALTQSLTDTLARRASVASTVARTWRRWRSPISTAAAVALGTVLATWGLWDTAYARSIRRGLGMAVPPRSTLYLTMNGGLGILRSGQLRVVPYNPTSAAAIAVSDDLGIRTMAGIPPYTTGGSFRLDGTPLPRPPHAHEGLCCFYDGTTDGRENFAVRQDSLLLEPAGSRPLAPPALYAFARDWSQPRFLFSLDSANGEYHGAAYSAATQSFWLTRRVGHNSVVEQWSRDGTRRSTLITLSSAALMGIAVDPKDDTLWALNVQYAAALIQLENFDTSGRHLGRFEAPTGLGSRSVGPTGAEFAWIARE